MPERIQRKRTKGWKMPPNTVYVGRPSRWGNKWDSAQEFEDYTQTFRHVAFEAYQNWLEPLRGKNLACWCPLDQPCHADVLLELANQEVDDA